MYWWKKIRACGSCTVKSHWK